MTTHHDKVKRHGWLYYGTQRFPPPNDNLHEADYERIRKAFENNLYKWQEDTNEMLFQGWHNVHCSPTEMLQRLGEVWGETIVELPA